MKTEKDSQYWTGVIAALVAKESATHAELAALAERKAPLCLAAHLGDRQALAEIEKIGIESRQLSAALPDLETAREQAEQALHAAQQAEQHIADLAKAETLRDAVISRLELCGKIDRVVVELVDLLLADIQQRQELSGLTGIQFNHGLTFGMAKSALAFELLDRRGIRPDHYCLRMEFSDYRKPASDSIWCQGWLESVNRRIDLLIDNDPAHKSLSIEETEIELQKAA